MMSVVRNSTVKSLGCIACVCATTMLTTPIQAAQHFWNLKEIYSNSSGTLQFIEMFTSSGGQNDFTAAQFTVNVTGAGPMHTFNVPQVNLVGDTTNKHLLFGTSGLQAAGGPAPDYIIPDNFLYTGGGSITFFGANSGAYTALPLDGLMSRIWGGGNNVTNSPTNFGMQTGVVNGVPEPTTMALATVAAGMCGMYRWVSRRRKGVIGSVENG